MPKVYFVDVTNRDGVQTARISLSKLQKTVLNLYLAEFGVHQSEAGFPYTKHEQNYFRANLALKEIGAFGSMVVSGWMRAIPQDVRNSLPTGIKDINLSISTSDQAIRHKYLGRLDRESIIKEMVEAARLAKASGVRTIGVNAEDGSRTDIGYLIEFAQAAKEAGADRVRYCDTLGCDSPNSIYQRVRRLAEAVKMTIELHCHNDLGMAVANSVAGTLGAIHAGQDAWINTTVNGIGERAGQADLLACILALKYAEGYKDELEIGDNINLQVAWRMAEYASRSFQVPIPINQPGVGANAFAHESGIHADGALKDRQNYELYDFELIGRGHEECETTGRVITTGEYGGIAGLKYVYGRLGIELADNDEAQRILELVQYANAHNQLPLTDDELRFIARYPDEVRAILSLAP